MCLQELSTDLVTCLTRLMSQRQASAVILAQQKSYVTYTAPVERANAPSITLLESQALIAASGTTGLRTWEAALRLGSFLFSAEGRHFIDDKNILELGAGTAFISLLCKKHLGAKYVLATDGSEQVTDIIASNICLNGLEGSGLVDVAVIEWGDTLIHGILESHGARKYDLIVGADVVCMPMPWLFINLTHWHKIYNPRSMSYLVSTLLALFKKYPWSRALISTTVRNTDTLEVFLKACGT